MTRNPLILSRALGAAVGTPVEGADVSAEQHKCGPWQPIQQAREKGAVPRL